MKIRPAILLFCAVSILVVVLLVWFAKRPAKVPMESVASYPSNNIVAVSPQQKATVSVVPSHPLFAPSPQATNMIPTPEKGAEEWRETMATKNTMPIVFYGKVIDQFNNALANTIVKINVSFNNGTAIGITNGQVTTDANGLFTVSGYSGEQLSVIPIKAGYALASLNGGGIYSLTYPESQRIHPDPDNPVVIKMWQLQGAEPLVSINCEFKLHHTNTPIYFDLINGKIVPFGGDIKITINRAPGIISGQNQLDWNVEIEAVDGGLMDSSGTERITYFAPEDGYQPSRTIYSTDRLPEGGLGGFHTDFYVKSRNGQVYSKLSLSFGINLKPDDPVYIGFSGLANTNGSRNWEGDPNTMNAIGQ